MNITGIIYTLSLSSIHQMHPSQCFRCTQGHPMPRAARHTPNCRCAPDAGSTYHNRVGAGRAQKPWRFKRLFGFLAQHPADLVLAVVLVVATSASSSFTNRPTSLLARQLGVSAIVFLGILDGRDTVDSGSALELNPLFCVIRGARMFLENTLGRARVVVGVAWYLERREPLCTRARRGNRSARYSAGRLEGQRLTRSILRSGGAQ